MIDEKNLEICQKTQKNGRAPKPSPSRMIECIWMLPSLINVTPPHLPAEAMGHFILSDAGACCFVLATKEKSLVSR